MRLILLILLSFAIQSCSASEKGGDSGSNGGNNAEIKNKIALADPFIMLHEGVYYAYGTNHNDGIEVYISNDLKSWRRPENLPQALVLHKNDVWGDNWFWAPEVYLVKGKFYMYFTAAEHICVATADSPLGPFKQDVQRPMITGEKCIDNSLFIDSDGTPYLYYDRFNDGLNIWVAELEDNLIDIKAGTESKCINVSQSWEEVWPRVNEGCFVIKRGDTYYMTYSANSYESQFYGIGCATAKSPRGPWTKYPHNPLLQKANNLVGVGHSAMFTDKDGKMRIVFHAHNSKEKIHPRHMYITNVNFTNTNGEDIMSLDKEFITPVYQP